MILVKYLMMLFICQQYQTVSSSTKFKRPKRHIFGLSFNENNKKFTEENVDILSEHELYDVNFVRDDSVRPSSQTIKWSQNSLCFYQCSKEYLLVDYYKNGDKSQPVTKVFVARQVGSPPSRINTADGVRVGEGQLHFGSILSFKGTNLFFVIHPNKWRPFQKSFKTNGLSESAEHLLSFGVETGLGLAVSSILTLALQPVVPLIAGGSVVVYVASGVVSGSTGYLAGTAFRRSYGKYLNFIGSSTKKIEKNILWT